MQWHRSGLIASWEFVEGHLERKNAAEDEISDKSSIEKHNEKKWGAMVIIKSLQFLPTVISAALRETTHNFEESILNGSVEQDSHGNMMHIALAGINNQMSLLQDRYAKCLSLFILHHRSNYERCLTVPYKVQLTIVFA